MTQPVKSSASPPAGERQALLWLVALGFFMQTLDATIVNTALPSMVRDLGESPLQMHSVIVAYSLAMAVLIPASGWLADRFGTRRVFTPAIALFVLGSVLCALSPTLALLVIGFAALSPGGPLAQLALFGAVNSVQYSAMNTVTLKDLEPAHASSGNSLLSMVQMLAMGMGVALAGAVLASLQAHFGDAGAAGVLNAFRITFACMGLLTLAATALFLQLPPHEPPRPHPLGPEEQS